MPAIPDLSVPRCLFNRQQLCIDLVTGLVECCWVCVLHPQSGTLYMPGRGLSLLMSHMQRRSPIDPFAYIGCGWKPRVHLFWLLLPYVPFTRIHLVAVSYHEGPVCTCISSHLLLWNQPGCIVGQRSCMLCVVLLQQRRLRS